jgi:hypothetical protein
VSELDRVTKNELIHYFSVCGKEIERKANYEEDKEAQVRALLLEFLAVRSIPIPDIDLTLSVMVFHVITVTLPNPM